MFKCWSERINKASGYLFLPFAYPEDYLKLVQVTFSNRPLVRELVHLTAYRRWFREQKFHTIIDVGAYIGAFAFAMKHILPAAKIYSFEPLPENFSRLSSNLAKTSSWKGFQTALGEREGMVDFWQNDFSPSSSVLPMADLHKKTFPQTAGSEQVHVSLSLLDRYIPQMDLQRSILLKVDVQGYEFAVLQGAIQTLKFVDWVICEVSYVPLYDGQASFDQIYTFMKKHGFEYAGSLDELLSPLDGTILQSDAVFKRCG
jgi:FkbM family methyltransferase